MAHEIATLGNLDSGYVLNLYAGLTGRAGNTIHPWSCPHIQQMTVPPQKIWGETIANIEQWLAQHNAELDPNTPYCSYCAV